MAGLLWHQPQHRTYRRGPLPAKSLTMKTLLRLIFRPRPFSPVQSPLFRYYMNEFNNPKRNRNARTGHI